MLRCGKTWIVLLLAGFTAHVAGAETGPPNSGDVTISHLSGKPVPRFEALRFEAVNGRTGPSQDHPIAWRYQRAGLPVLVLKETRGWRFVRDPGGDEVWMHERTLTGTAMAMALEDATLVSAPRATAPPQARIEAGALVSLGRCNGGFCHVSSGPHGGWAPMDMLWGAGLGTPTASRTGD